MNQRLIQNKNKRKKKKEIKKNLNKFKWKKTNRFNTLGHIRSCQTSKDQLMVHYIQTRKQMNPT